MEPPEVKGPLTIAELLQSRCNKLPEDPGVYFVIAPKDFDPRFINPGTGGRFKRKNPNVDLDTVKSRWIPDCPVLYIGQGNNLRGRVRLLLRFGQGKAVSHKGGRLLWKIKSSQELLLKWYQHDSPREEERRLLAKFKEGHDGRLPFANLQG